MCCNIKIVMVLYQNLLPYVAVMLPYTIYNIYMYVHLTGVSYSYIAECGKTIVAFSFVFICNRGRSLLVIALSLAIARWPLKRFDYLLWNPRVFCNVDGGNRIQMACLDRAVECAIGFCNVMCRQ